MNALPPIDGLDPRKEQLLQRMLFLSIGVHVALFFLGLTISPLFPSMQVTPPVFVELTDAPSAETQPLKVAPAVRADSSEGSPRTPASPRPGARENPAARRWLEKLDASVRNAPEANVAPKEGQAGGIPVRSRTSDGPAKWGDFAPAGVPGGTAALGKQMADLEARVRRSGRPGVGTGSETEASMMYGGQGDTAGGGGIPAWLRDMIRRRVRDSLPELEAVYNESIRRNPELRGKLIVRFRIDPSGKVQRAESVEGDVRDPAFVNLILERIRRWNFDPTGGHTVDVLYPFIFIAPS
jgi:outer membrane biosynthesis protein TonB